MIGLAGMPAITGTRPELAGNFSRLVQQPIDYAPYNYASIYWLTWITVVLPIGFLPFELYQLGAGHPENTLSAQIWRLAHVVAGQPINQWAVEHFWVAGVLTLLFSWLIVHFDFGWLR